MDKTLPVIAASIVGIVLGFSVGLMVRPAPTPAPAPAPAVKPDDTELKRLRKDLEDARARITDLERQLADRPVAAAPATAKPVEPAAPRKKPTLADLKTAFEALAKKGLMAFQDQKAVRELVEDFKALGPEGIQALADLLLTSKKSSDRFLAGMLLEQIGDPAAIPALTQSLRSEKDDLVRRMASHALAVIGTKDALGPLAAAMAGDADWGVRVNSAYGLAKQGDDAGVKMLQESYLSADTPAAYKLSILGGMSDVGNPAYGPIFRNILETSKDMGPLLMAVAGLEKIGGTAWIAALEAAAGDASLPDTVREAAKKAAEELRK